MMEKALLAKNNSMHAISIERLSKRFEDVHALEDISFVVNKGEVFGLLGPNGAGKTTTITILTGLAHADSGRIQIWGIDCAGKHKAVQSLIGVVADESNLYPELTGFENLCFCASLYGMPKAERQARAKELLHEFELVEAANRKFAGYSKGMKRKLTIAAGIIHRPSILFLDEPTTGIDVASARRIRRMISELNKTGTTIFLTTHYIEEAERLCHRIAFIVAGKIVQIDTVNNLLRFAQNKHLMQISLSKPLINITDTIESEFPHLKIESHSDELFKIESDEPIRITSMVSFLEKCGVEVLEARRMHPSLEDIFVDITGIEAETMKKEKEKSGGGA